MSNKPVFAEDFLSLPLKNWIIQSKDDATRATLVKAEGRDALRLLTLPGDNNVVNSGDMERSDGYQCIPETADAVLHPIGFSAWWAHSVLFPDDFIFPNGEPTNVTDFHNDKDSASAPFALNFGTWGQPAFAHGQLQIQRCFGDNPMKPQFLNHIIGIPKRNFWYDFVYHIRWSDKSDGYAIAYVNGELVMSDCGPTMFPGQKAYLKLAMYRYPTTPNGPCAVLHSRIRQGTSRKSVEAS